MFGRLLDGQGVEAVSCWVCGCDFIYITAPWCLCIPTLPNTLYTPHLQLHPSTPSTLAGVQVGGLVVHSWQAWWVREL